MAQAPTPQPTAAQAEALRRLHAYLDAAAVAGPGMPDTPALREARELRTEIELGWPAIFPPAKNAAAGG